MTLAGQVLRSLIRIVGLAGHAPVLHRRGKPLQIIDDGDGFRIRNFSDTELIEVDVCRRAGYAANDASPLEIAILERDHDEYVVFHLTLEEAEALALALQIMVQQIRESAQ